MAETISMVILGEPVSLKNRRPIHRNRKTGRPFPGKSEALTAFERSFQAQVPKSAKRGLQGNLATRITVYYASRRPDLEISAVYDQLQAACVIGNDRQIVEKHEFKRLDRDNPRVEIEIWEEVE